MRKTIHLLLLISIIIGLTDAATAQKNYQLHSPDGKIVVNVTADLSLKYDITHENTVVIAPSTIALELQDGTIIGDHPKIIKTTTATTQKTINAPFYKKASVEEHYNELTLWLKGDFNITFRAYNEGVAYRFVNNRKTETAVVGETASFSFQDDYSCYAAYSNGDKTSFETQLKCSFENTYDHQPITKLQINRLIICPLLVALPDGKKACITEADLENYPGMLLTHSSHETGFHGYFAHYPKMVTQGGHNMLQGIVSEREPFIAKNIGKNLPWRVVVISTSDKELANCDMVYRLAAPSRIEDISWIQPGKVAWDWWNDWNLYNVDFRSGINNETYRYYIDFAAKYGIEYVILDEGWSVNKKADLMQVVPEIDLSSLVAYGKDKNVGIVLWAGYWAFNRDMENIVKHYSEMGIKGFKIDFMDRNDQMISNFLYQAAETCARYKMFIDFHGIHQPTGLQRTFPNVLNYEGVFGLEQMKWAAKETDMVTYDVTIPFIRMVAGPMDYTQGAMRNAIKNNYRPVWSEAMSQGTRCRQLAEYIIFESPFNMLCDNPSNYMNEPECTQLISEIPTVWDETIVVDGKVAEYIIIARRRGDDWYIGGMTNWKQRQITLDLSAIDFGNNSAILFKDGINADKAARDYQKEQISIPPDKKLPLVMAPGGGFVIHIKK